MESIERCKKEQELND